MKRIFTLSAFLLSCLFASAQVCETRTDNSRVIVGLTEVNSPAVHAGLHNARFDVQSNQIALVAGHPCVSAYYAIYDENYRLITCGVFSKMRAGEIEIVKVGRPADKCRVVVSGSPLIAQK